MLAAQGIQDPILIDTSFLSIGHVDEQIQFVPGDGPTAGRSRLPIRGRACGCSATPRRPGRVTRL
jgi:hypothetical protein